MNESRSTSKTYLVTGGAGFIGSHLAEHLLATGNRVLVLDDLTTGQMSNVAHLVGRDGFHLARADVRDGVVLDRLASQADVIVHLAAVVGVRLIVEEPARTIETNVGGTDAVLKAAHRYGSRVLLASTSEVYGKGVKIPFSEDDDVLLGSTSKSRWAYAISKMLDESLAFAFAKEHGLDVVPFRLFNTVGPRQTGRYGMVIPRFVRQALADEPLTVYGDGTQRRCFCDVRDVVRALHGLAEHPDAGGRVYNIGGTEEISINVLAERVKSLAGSASTIQHVSFEDAYGPDFEDMERRVPDLTRVQSLLDWKPERSLDSILESVLAYEKSSGASAES